MDDDRLAAGGHRVFSDGAFELLRRYLRQKAAYTGVSSFTSGTIPASRRSARSPASCGEHLHADVIFVDRHAHPAHRLSEL
jgi:hypothetical protein